MMSTVGKPVKVQKEKLAKMSSSQNGKPETSLANKNQPTAEQIRLAQIISDRSEGDPEITAKVNQIIDLTGRSSDEVMTVLYDCDYDINRTVEKLLESQEAIVDEWQVIDKKKKVPAPNKGSPPETPSDLKFETLTEPEFELNHTENNQHGRGARGAPRFPRGRGRASWSDRSDRSWNSISRERETGYDPNRARRRGNFGELRSRGGRRGQRSMHSNKFETQIDTWTSESMPNGENDSRIGSWTEVTDEWTADEWNGSLHESCVFTPSASSRSTQIYSASNDANNGLLASTVHQGTAMTFESMNRPDQGGMPGDVNTGGSGASFSSMHPLAKTSSRQDSMGQHYVAKDSSASSPSVNEVGNCFGSISDRTMFVSHYNREATECIKSVMGIGRNSLDQNSPATDEIARTAGHQPPISLQPSSSLHIQGVKNARPRLPPPSKIPSMPVEMPDSMNSGRLDVQFGSWDVIPAASDSKASFISDIIPPSDYKGSAKISSSQSPSVSGMAQPLASSYETNMSKAQVTLSESHVTTASKANMFPSSLAANKGNETLHHMMSSSSSDLLTSVTKAGGSASSSQLGYSQLAYSSSSCDGVSGSGGGAKLLPSNGPNHYSTSYTGSYHSGPSSLVTMSSDYNLTQEQLQYTYGDSQRYRANGPPTQQNFNSAVFPPGYNSGPLPNQLHYGSSPGPTKLFASDKPSANAYSMGSDVAGLYTDKQGAAFSTSLAPQSFDSTSVYQSTGVFHSGGGGQPSSISLSYPGMTSGLTFQGMQVESGGFDAEQYPTYRQKDGPAGYDIAGAANGQKSAVTSAQGQISQSFSSNFGSGSTTATQSTGGSPFTGQSQSAPPMGTQGQSGPLGNQRQGTSAVPGFANHASSSSQSFVGQVEASTSATALSSGAGLSATAGGKLSDSVSKLNLKDGKPGGDLLPMTTSADGASLSAAGGMVSIGSAVVSTVTGIMTSKTSLPAAAKSSLSQSKPLANMATGMASGTAAMLNHNYVIGQPPGFQLAAFGYPAAQQPLTYSSFEELQMLQQRFSNPMSYYDLTLQTSAALASRDPTGPLGAQSYTGGDMKLTAMDVLSPVNAQPAQQPQAVTGNQQAFINHGLHPAAAYSYYYPGPTGILPYYPMVPMAISSVSNPTLAGTTPTTQFQKPAVFGSHAYAMGMNAPSGDLMTGATGFGKTHVQTFERGGFHGGTPPPNFGMTMPPGGTQAAGPPTVYGPPYLPLVPPHQQSHSQLLHHAVPQESAVAGRPAPPTGAQQKMGGNKAYSAAYWGSN